MDNNIAIHVDFGGGLDLVFDGHTDLHLTLPPASTLQTLITQLATHHANHKRDMFAINNQMYHSLTQPSRDPSLSERSRLVVG